MPEQAMTVVGRIAVEMRAKHPEVHFEMQEDDTRIVWRCAGAHPVPAALCAVDIGWALKEAGEVALGRNADLVSDSLLRTYRVIWQKKQ